MLNREISKNMINMGISLKIPYSVYMRIRIYLV